MCDHVTEKMRPKLETKNTALTKEIFPITFSCVTKKTQTQSCDPNYVTKIRDPKISLCLPKMHPISYKTGPTDT